MSLFEDDFVIVEGVHYHAPAWPPPDFIRADGQNYMLTNYSRITDEERKEMTHVCRGGEYAPLQGSLAQAEITDVTLMKLNAVSLDEFMKTNKRRI